MDKAVVLARGLGTRMRRADPAARLTARQARAAEAGLKALIDVGRPFLDYGLTALADAGYRRACLVVGPEHDELRDYYGRQVRPARLEISFAVQQTPRGTADAVLAAEQFAGGEPFLVVNCDNYYPVNALAALRRLRTPGLVGFGREGMLAGGNIPPERVPRFAIIRDDGAGWLAEIVEKPDEQRLASLPQPLRLSMNCWRFDGRIFAACRAIAPSARGELELPDAVQHAMAAGGVRFRVVPCEQAVLDLTSRADVPAVAALLAGVKVSF